MAGYKTILPEDTDTLRNHYDFSQMGTPVVGKYWQRYQQGTNMVKLDDDILAVFADSEAVNQSLRHFLAENGDAHNDVQARMVYIDDDLREIFPTARAINDALRFLSQHMPQEQAFISK